MLIGLLLLLLPLILGYLVVLNDERWRTLVSRSVGATIHFILLLMGLSLAGLDDLASQFSRMGVQALVLFALTASLNLSALALLDRWRHRRQSPATGNDSSGGALTVSLLDGGRLIGVVGLGVALGLLWPQLTMHADRATEMALYVLLGLIGIQLRNAGVALHSIVLNRFGLAIAMTLAGSSLLAGLLVSPLLDWPWAQGLAMSAGFGWYSLSAVVIGDQLGPALGGVALFNDLGRELLAMLLIPLLTRQRPAMGVGYAGATAMDVTLPMIQRAGGLERVPLALVSGFLLSLAAPPIMLTVLALGSGT
ncbi:lysine exporter LysO family protein [Kushneria phosphatilytica]|uniref:Lysine exporter LysO family protein n=1 Tax=Kushneria phosphatilytica TaxID=657387 RepID=A0A1S1NZL8_9GAMM|nr:lysine exporter LysO family protein [Kushneria phosphatilytica]OHV13842.1 hypothetical protein BH688_00330 [Kushneria phosphatilytica]QEL10395.1 lysine exporter LysO family protein [Kushneria phosphatilytica]